MSFGSVSAPVRPPPISEVLQRRLVAERAAFAQGIAAVEESVYGSRSWRYTAPMRRALKLFRRNP